MARGLNELTERSCTLKLQGTQLQYQALNSSNTHFPAVEYWELILSL